MIIVSTIDQIPGKTIKTNLGLVKGNTVRTKNLFTDIGAGLKNLVGGELRSYTDMLSQARDEALNRMINEAVKLDADAVVGVRFMTSSIMASAAEILAFGTAVKLK